MSCELEEPIARESITLVGPLPPLHTGMAAQMVRWAEGLRAEGHPLRVVDTRPRDRVKRVRRWLSFMWRLVRALPSARWVSVHSGSDVFFFAFTAPSVLLGRALGKRVLVTYKGGRAEPFLNRHPYAGGVLRLAHEVLVPSPYLQRVLSELAGVKPCVVPNILVMIPPDPLPPATRQPVRLMVARNFDPIYDIGTAIRAFRIVRERWPDASLELFGDGPERRKLESLATEQVPSGISFHGNRPPAELRDWYLRSTLALNPSTVDNTPNSVVEAMAFGVPVVTTNVGGVPDLVRQGRAAVLVPPRQPEAMGRAVLDLLEDDARYQQLRAEGLKVAADFRWSAVYARFRRAALGVSVDHESDKVKPVS